MKKVAIKGLEIEVTNRCNMNCPHCYYYESWENGKDYNNYLDLNAIDKFIKDLDIEYINTITFTGGEPLLAENEIISVLHKLLENKMLVFQIDIATNGTILSERIANGLVDFSQKMYELMENYENLQVRKTLRRILEKNNF